MKRKLRNGETVMGIICNSGSPTLVEVLGYVGFDYVVIDTEHTPITLDEKAAHLIRAAEIGGLTPLIRVSTEDPTFIHKSLDMGAQGIFVALVNTREDARKIVEAVKYPPMGRRAFGPGRHLGRHRYGMDRKTYVDYWNRESMVMFLVETTEGVDNLDEIVTVPGIDVMGIGQGDLAVDLGAPAPRFGNPDCVKAVEKLLELCKPRGIFVRDIFNDIDTARKWYAKGIRVFEWGFDVEVFQTAAKRIISTAESLRKPAKA